MATETTCPHCGKPVPATALQGICPECMLKAGLIETGEVGPDGTVAAKPPSPPAPPVEQIAPHFPHLEILECLGRGGMGTVYKARQPKLDRFVALKILTRRADSGISDTEFAARFQQEARALARLNHPDIVAVYDFGEAGGCHYLLMEYVDGLTLRQLLQTKRLSPEEALTIVPKICAALQFAHERGIVHRDIKPENILLDREGRVKIADFGIAKILAPTGRAGSPLPADAPQAQDGAHGVTRPTVALTGPKDVIGTPHYMAPEQIERPVKVDHRADIYSLGVVFYEMLTGELPLGKFQPPSKKVQVDVRLDEVVLHALEKEPERRYQHASQVKTDVETIAASPQNKTADVSAPATAPASRAVRRWFAPLVVVREGRRVIHWPGVLQDAFMLAGIYSVAWLAVVMLLSPVIRAPHVAALLGGVLGFVAAMLAFGFYRSFKTPVPKLRKQDAQRPGMEGRSNKEASALLGVIIARWTARIFGTLLLVFYVLFILAEGLPPIASQPEGVQLNFVALGLMLAGFVAGWKREGTAALLIACGWTLWQISEGRIKWNLFQTPLPVAMLYGLCWWATRGRRTSVVAGAVLVLAVTLGLGHLFLPTSVFVRGAVVDAQTGQPVADAELRLLPRTLQALEKGDPANARANQNGRFTLYVGWYAPAKEVALSAPGYEMLTTNLGPRALGERNVSRDFQLQPVAGAPVEPEVPPVVIHTIPESGTANVDPAITELQVTFSKPMRNGSWSWTIWGEENFPETTGAARYLADGQTCVLPVKLKPGKLYAIWLNSEDHHDFKDREGQSAVPYLLIFETRK